MSRIIGLPYWDDRDKYYIQTNNSLEQALRRYKAAHSVVTCGPTAAVNCLAAMGVDLSTYTPGGWGPQPEDVLTLWFHDPRNWSLLEQIRPETAPNNTDYSPNEVPQYYPAAVRSVFDVPAQFKWGADFKTIAKHIEQGKAVQICLIAPGHYVAVVAIDAENRELIYHDSYPQRFGGGDGFAQRMGVEELETNVKPFLIVYGGGN